MNISHTKRKTALALLAMLAAPFTAQAQSPADYPNKPIRLIVPFAPGGNTDVAARLIAHGLSELLGQQVVVDNRGGASGSIGAAAVARAPADGYTLLVGSGAMTINPSVFAKLPYDVVKDFEPVGLAMSTSLVMVASTQLGVRSVAELIAAAKAKPGQLKFGSAGVGSGSHLAGELFNQTAKIQALHVPYKGSGPATTGILTGEVDFTFTSQAATVPLFKDDKVRVLAVTGKHASPIFPGVPTIGEAGVQDYEAGDWIGIIAPAGTPKAIVDRLNGAIDKWLKQPGTQPRLAQLGFEPRSGTPEQFSALIRSELAKWSRTAKAANIQVE